MKTTAQFKRIVAALRVQWAALQAIVVSYWTRWIAWQRRRRAALKAWLVRKLKLMLWLTALLVTTILVIYLYRRSPAIRTAVDNLLAGALYQFDRLKLRLRRWWRSEPPAPVTAIAGPQVAVGRQEKVPAAPAQDGTRPAEL